jgi:hypothetical protein
MFEGTADSVLRRSQFPQIFLTNPSKLRIYLCKIPTRDAGTGGGRRGSRPRCPLPGGARGAKVPFQFKGLPWRNSELSEMLVQFFYEFAPENARNAVSEPQEFSTIAWPPPLLSNPSHPYHPINRKHD